METELKRYTADRIAFNHVYDQFYERSQREWVTAEQLVDQGLQLADQDFRKAYWDYQRLLEIIDDPTPSKIKIFKQCLTEVNQKYSGSRSEASKADKALLTLYDNLIPVITALEPQYCHYTNGPLEGINRKIKQIQRTAYGYRNFEHLKARIYLQTYLGKDTRSSVKTA